MRHEIDIKRGSNLFLWGLENCSSKSNTSIINKNRRFANLLTNLDSSFVDAGRGIDIDFEERNIWSYSR